MANDRWYYVGEVAAQLIAAACEVNDPSSVRVHNESRFLDDEDDFPCLIDISKPTWICYCDRLQPRKLEGLAIKLFDEFTEPDPDKPREAATVSGEGASEAGEKRASTQRPKRAKPRN
jgi:hypothetical protein